MSPQHPLCRAIEPDLLSVAAGEAGSAAAGRVDAHVAACGLCRDELAHYRALEGMMGTLRRAPLADDDATLARAQLASRLSDLRSRMVGFGIFPSPLGRILIGRSEQGVALVQYLPADGSLSAHVRRLLGEDAVEDRAATEELRAELVEYLEGRRARLDWPLDLRRMRSDFQRRVLEATAALPYGAVTSYAGIAARIGAPSAVRPVAQALRWNPLPIVIPCHRVIGGSGALTGYAGRRVELKQRLLAVEGVKMVAARNDFKVDREAMYTMVTGDQRVLRADLRLAPVDVAVHAHAVRHAGGRRGRRLRALHQLPARSASAPRLARPRRLLRRFTPSRLPVSQRVREDRTMTWETMNRETETTIMIALIPIPGGVDLCSTLSRRVQRRREERVARQIALTDAIHRELGAVAAPDVTRSLTRRVDGLGAAAAPSRGHGRAPSRASPRTSSAGSTGRTRRGCAWS